VGSATPSEAAAELVLYRDQRLLVARRCSAPVASAAVNALRSALRLQPLGRVLYKAEAVEGAADTFALQSLFILDVLANRLREEGLVAPNLTVARFKVGDTAVEDDADEDVRRPTLRAVRFEGDHLLDSATACKLLAEEGRALVDIAMHFDVPASDAGAAAASFPARVAVDADHALVMTSFGTRRPELSVGLQRTLVEVVAAELRDGVLDAARLAQLCGRILERARTEGPIKRADMLDDDSSEPDQPVI
jgi:hypothetical protein